MLEILQGELKLVMGNCGTRTVADITPRVRRHARLEGLERVA